MTAIAIYRHQLFKLSETFITNQAERLPSCDVIYLGRERLAAGPAGADSRVLRDLPGQTSRAALIRQVISRDPTHYLRLLADRRIALIHAHFGVEGVYALPIARRLKIPLVTTFHGFDATTTRLALLTAGHPSWWNYLLHRRTLAAGGQHFICVSEFIRRQVVTLGFPESRTEVHYIGVDTDAIQPTSSRLPEPMVLHVARLVEKKGTRDLIAAFALVRQRVPEAKLVIIGDGPLRASLRRQVQELSLTDHVSFRGAQPYAEVLQFMARAWLIALPSVQAKTGDAEGFGLVLAEAAASGVPSVATRHGGIPEAVKDGETGVLCAEHDSTTLATAIIDLLRDDALRNRMGRAARRHAETHFNLTRQSARLQRIYADVLRAAP